MPLNLSDLSRLVQNDPKLFTLDISKEENIDADDIDTLLTNLQDNTHLGRIKWPKALPQDDKSQKQLQKIKEILDKNNANFTAHPSHYQYAVLSKHVYEPKSVGQSIVLQGQEYAIEHHLPGWEVAEVFDLNRENGLYATLYINPRAGHCVLAFRGTEIIPRDLAPPPPTAAPQEAEEIDNASYLARIKHWFNWGIHTVTAATEQTQIGTRDLLTDISLITGRITAQQVDAYQLAFQVAAYADRHGYRLSFTGHSLGGWLAQLMAIHLFWDCRLDSHSILRATCAELEVVTFDNPGVDAMVAAIQPTVEKARQAWQETLQEFAKVATVYLTVPNPVNTAGRQFGKVYRLITEVPDLNPFVVESFFQWAATPETLKRWSDRLGVNFEGNARWAINKTITTLGLQTGLSHSMRYLLKAFDPATGEPQHAKQVHDWPVVDWAASDNPARGWIKTARNQTRHKLGAESHIKQLFDTIRLYTRSTVPEFLFKKSKDFVLDQILGLMFNLFKLPKEFKDLPQELLQIPGVVYLWCSGEVNSDALKEFLAFAQQFGEFDINQSETVMPLNQSYYLQFKHHYRADLIDSRRRPLQDFSDEGQALLGILEDFNELQIRGSATTDLIAGSYFVDPAFVRLQRQFTIELARAVGGARYFDVRLQQGTLSAFEQQLFRLLQLYRADVPKGWIKYWEIHKAQRALGEKIQAVDTFHIRDQVWQGDHRAIYRKQQFLTNLFSDDQPQSIETAYVNLMLLQEEQVKHTKSEDKSASSSESQDTREAYLSSFEDIYTTKTPLSTTALFTQPTQKRYLILGRAGIGKSTLLQYLTYQWAHNAWAQQFEWMFWIKLRNIIPQHYSSRTLEWIDIVIRESFDYSFNTAEKQHLKDLLTPLIAQGKVLWLLDGYDEIAAKLNQLEYAALKPAVEELIAMPWLILTSRPEAMMQDRSFDQRLEIIGFTNTDIEQYIARYFERDAESGQRLLGFLRKNPSLWGVAHIPINLQLLCHSWREKPLVADINLTQLYQSLVNRLLQRYAQKQGLLVGDDQSALMTHSTLKPLMQTLSEIAFEGMTQGHVVISTETARIKPLLAVGLIRMVQQETDSVTTIEFIHLTFQEFLAGFYLAQLIIHQSAQVESLIAQYKYDPHLEITWWFVAGLLVPQPEKLQLFFSYLLREPRDLTGLYEHRLLMRCLDESAATEFPGKAALWEKLQAFWQGVLHLQISYQPLLDRLALSAVMAEKLVRPVIENTNLHKRTLRTTLSALLQAKPALADQMLPWLLEKLESKDWSVSGLVVDVLPAFLLAKPALADQDQVLSWLFKKLRMKTGQKGDWLWIPYLCSYKQNQHWLNKYFHCCSKSWVISIGMKDRRQRKACSSYYK